MGPSHAMCQAICHIVRASQFGISAAIVPPHECFVRVPTTFASEWHNGWLFSWKLYLLHTEVISCRWTRQYLKIRMTCRPK